MSNIVQHPLYVSIFTLDQIAQNIWIGASGFSLLDFSFHLQSTCNSIGRVSIQMFFQGGSKLKFIYLKVSSSIIIFEGTQTYRRYVVYYISNIIRNTPPCPPSVSTILTTVNICKSSSCVSIVLFSIHPLFQVAGSECKNLS